LAIEKPWCETSIVEIAIKIGIVIEGQMQLGSISMAISTPILWFQFDPGSDQIPQEKSRVKFAVIRTYLIQKSRQQKRPYGGMGSWNLKSSTRKFE